MLQVKLSFPSHDRTLRLSEFVLSSRCRSADDRGVDDAVVALLRRTPARSLSPVLSAQRSVVDRLPAEGRGL